MNERSLGPSTAGGAYCVGKGGASLWSLSLPRGEVLKTVSERYERQVL